MSRHSRFVRFFLIPAALFGSLAAGVAVAAGPMVSSHGPEQHHAMVMNHLEDIADELGLSEEQRVEIRAILEDSRVRGEAIRAQHDELRDGGIDLFSADKLDPAAIEAHRQQMLDLANQGSAVMADTALAVADVLTPEQRAAAADKARAFHEDGGWRGKIRQHLQGQRPMHGEWR